VAPLTVTPFFRHWKLSGAVPVTATEKVAVCPTVTFALTGCVVIDGPVAAAATLRVAALLVALPALLPTTTAKSA